MNGFRLVVDECCPVTILLADYSSEGASHLATQCAINGD